MCVRNAALFVAQAVESILGQTLRELELVVVDDASSDRSPDILASFARRDSRIRVLRSSAPLGVAAALNLACDEARGPLVARLDGDDVAVPDRLERQATYLAAHERVAVVGGAAVVIDESGKSHHLLRPPADDATIRAELVRQNCMVHPTVMLRRAALRSAGGYRARFVGAEDYDLWLRLAERHQLANLPDVLVRYRVHPEQVSHQDLEARALAVLAAQALARRRRAGRDETPSDERPISRADLAELGVSEDAVESGIAEACLDRALLLDDIDRPRLALAALARTPGFAVSPAVRRRTVARYHAALARRRWRRAQRARSLASALRALRARPALLGRVASRLIRRDRTPPGQ